MRSTVGHVWWTSILLAVAAHLGESQLRYVRPREVFPMSTEEFARRGHTGKGTYEKIFERGSSTKWRQTINGIPVFGSVITTQHDKYGNVTLVEGYEGDTITFANPKPSWHPLDATESLKKSWNHSKLREADWSFEDPELYILKTNYFDKLVWKIEYFVNWRDEILTDEGLGPIPAHILGLVNAHSGKVEESWNNIQNAKIRAITGNRKIGKSFHEIDVDRKYTNCWHVDDYHHVEVRDMRNNEKFKNYTTRFLCDDADKKDWDSFDTTGSFSPRNEAFLNAVKYVDMWRKLAGKEVAPYKDGLGLQLIVHYGKNFDNARFMYKAVVFGDGGHLTYPMTSLDLVCHELAHGITYWKGGMMMYEGEPGALNEAYSDIVGMTCNMHFLNRTDFLFGADIMKPGTDDSLRDMCHPSRFGSLEHYDEYAARVKGEQEVDVHLSSGIYNKAWCKLTKTKGWNYIKTFEIFTDANLSGWNYIITMHCGACFVERKAALRSYSKADVTAAFKSVGVHCSKCKS